MVHFGDTVQAAATARRAHLKLETPMALARPASWTSSICRHVSCQVGQYISAKCQTRTARHTRQGATPCTQRSRRAHVWPRHAAQYLDGGVHAVALVASEGPVNDVFIQVAQPQLLLQDYPASLHTGACSNNDSNMCACSACYVSAASTPSESSQWRPSHCRGQSSRASM